MQVKIKLKCKRCGNYVTYIYSFMSVSTASSFFVLDSPFRETPVSEDIIKSLPNKETALNIALNEGDVIPNDTETVAKQNFLHCTECNAKLLLPDNIGNFEDVITFATERGFVNPEIILQEEEE